MDLFGLRKMKLRRDAKNGVEKLLTTKVKGVMTDYVVTIAPEKKVTDAAQLMIGEDVSALVVEKDDRPIGILTERDFIKKVPVSPKVFDLTVKDIMSGSFAGAKNASQKNCAVESLHPEASLRDARNLLREKKIRKIVVTTTDGLAAGIITQSDLSKALYNLTVIPRLSDAKFTINDIMSRKILSVPRTEKFAAAKKLMAAHNLSALPVTVGKEYVGIFTEYDVVAQFYDAGGRLDIREIPALMKTPLKVISSDLNIFDANTIMLFEKVRRLLVVENGKVVGIITQTDLVHACFDYVERVEKALVDGTPIPPEGYVQLKRSNAIVSEYIDQYLRAYTVR